MITTNEHAIIRLVTRVINLLGIDVIKNNNKFQFKFYEKKY